MIPVTVKVRSLDDKEKLTGEKRFPLQRLRTPEVDART
jgi:tRNA-dihydrouridine synthase